MVKGLYTGWSGMINEMNRMDVMTNNLANADTNGYKKEAATAQSFDDRLAVRIKDLSYNGLKDDLDDVRLGAKIGETYTDWSQGSFQVTDSQYDVALDGMGFFGIEFTSKDGESSVKYTRDGAFTMTKEGFLVTKDGDFVLNQNAAQSQSTGAAGYIQMDPNLPFKIDQNGYIWQNDQIVDRLGVVDFENYDFLEKYGENLIQPIDGATIIDANVKVEQGCIEASNVNIVTEMVSLIQISRAYEANQKVVQTMDSMLDKAVNQVGKV